MMMREKVLRRQMGLEPKPKPKEKKQGFLGNWNDAAKRIQRERDLAEGNIKIEGAGCTYTQNEDDCYRCEQLRLYKCPWGKKE